MKKNKLALVVAVFAIFLLAESVAAQSVGGPNKPTNSGGSTVQKNPVVPTPRGGTTTPTPTLSPTKQLSKKH
jgi:hypothetical protein